jgi:hypothetical protein
MVKYPWLSTALGLFFLTLTCPALAQEKCDDATVRRLGGQPVGLIATPDIYFNTRSGEQPLIGSQGMEALRLAHSSERRNQRPYVFAPQQFVVTADGSMAYDDGTAHVEYDEVGSGKHVSFDITYLPVWRVVDGKCRVAAAYSRPVGQ